MTKLEIALDILDAKLEELEDESIYGNNALDSINILNKKMLILEIKTKILEKVLQSEEK